jgi:creatinine amidohydrolase
MSKSILLEELTWKEAEQALNEKSIVVIPLGAQCKEHGLHLKLKNDWILAEYLKQELQKQVGIIIAPTVNYNYYPAFIEYPGSISIKFETACNLIIDICESISAFGPKYFYVLNTGVSTEKVLAQAAIALRTKNIYLQYTKLDQAFKNIQKEICQQDGGSHADEVETSMMLYIDRASVNMSKAVNNFDAEGKGFLTRTRSKSKDGCYSPSGVWGNPMLASAEKGKKLIECLLEYIIADINSLKEDVT